MCRKACNYSTTAWLPIVVRRPRLKNLRPSTMGWQCSIAEGCALDWSALSPEWQQRRPSLPSRCKWRGNNRGVTRFRALVHQSMIDRVGVRTTGVLLAPTCSAWCRVQTARTHDERMMRKPDCMRKAGEEHHRLSMLSAHSDHAFPDRVDLADGAPTTCCFANTACSVPLCRGCCGEPNLTAT